MTAISAREFNRDVSAAKRAALEHPVVITDRGEPSHVLLSIDAYRRLSGKDSGWVASIQMPEDDIDFDPPQVGFAPRSVDF